MTKEASVTKAVREYVETFVSAPRVEAGELRGLISSRARYLSHGDCLEMCLRLAKAVPGAIVEFGVGAGGSTRFLRRMSRKPIFGLDTFQGYPEAFERVQVGQFAQPNVPDIPGVNIVKGFFEDTCTDELAGQIGRVAFAHFDADLYSSTLVALRWLTPLLRHGSVLLFDEFLGGGRSEARALADWQKETGMIVARIAEFDRAPSGGGDLPDKRLLFQVIFEAPEPIERISWAATARTHLKRSTNLAAKLSDAEKIEVQPGALITTERNKPFEKHEKLSGVSLEGKPLGPTDWFISPGHWEKV